MRVIQNKCGSVGMYVKTYSEIFRFQKGSKKATMKVDKVSPHDVYTRYKAVSNRQDHRPLQYIFSYNEIL